MGTDLFAFEVFGFYFTFGDGGWGWEWVYYARVKDCVG